MTRRKPKGQYISEYTDSLNFVVPKGLVGYNGRVPNFSTKVMVEAWMLQILSGGDEWCGKELIQEIRRRTQHDKFKGYEPSQGVVFDMLRLWAQEGIIDPTNPGRKSGPYNYRITPKGLEYLAFVRVTVKEMIAGAARVLYRLQSDLFGQSPIF